MKEQPKPDSEQSSLLWSRLRTSDGAVIYSAQIGSINKSSLEQAVDQTVQ